jgi:hypothetical protein
MTIKELVEWFELKYVVQAAAIYAVLLGTYWIFID